MTQSSESDAMVEQGISQLERGNPKAAITLLTRALRRNPTSIYAYTNRASAYTAIGDYQRVLNDLSRALELAPDTFALHFNRGNTYAQMGDTVRAIADYERAIYLSLHDINAYFNRAMLLFRQDPKRAIEDLSTVIQLQPSHALAYVERGKLYHNMQKFNFALRDFKSALALNSDAKPYCSSS